MGKVLVSASHFDTLCKDAWKLLEDNGHEVVFDRDRVFPAYSKEELIKILPDMDAAIIGLDDYTDPDVWKAARKLKVANKFGVGVDNISIELANEHGAKVCNCPGQNSNSVAELTIALIIDVLRHVVEQHEQMKNGQEWTRPLGTEIKGKTIGLYGFGAIARMVAEKLKAFDVILLAYDPYPNAAAAEKLGVKLVSPETLIESSDIISLHAPATQENYHLFNKDVMAKMKKGSFLVNAARGALVDLDALADALQSGQIAGAALDAFEVEPLPKDSKIFHCSNIVLTEHAGAETREAYMRVGLTAAQNVVDVLAGREPKFCVNK